MLRTDRLEQAKGSLCCTHNIPCTSSKRIHMHTLRRKIFLMYLYPAPYGTLFKFV